MVDLSYSPQIQTEGLPGRDSPRLPDELPSGGQQIGRAFESAADTVQQHAVAAIDASRKAMFADGDNQMQAAQIDATHNPKTGAFTKQGKDAFNLGEQYLPNFQATTQAIIDSTPDPMVRQQLQQQAQRRTLELSSQLDSHEILQHRNYMDGTFQAAGDMAIKGAVANYNDPGITQSNLDKLDSSLQQRADLNGWSPEQLTDAVQQAHSKLHEGMLTNMVSDQKFDMAAHYLDVIKGDLSPVEYERATKSIQSGVAGEAADSIVGMFRTGGPDTGAQAYKQLDDSNLSDEMKNQVREHVRQGLGLLNEQRRLQYANQITNLETGIASGSPPASARATAAFLYHSYALDQQQYAASLSGIVRAEKKDTADEDNLELASSAFAAHTPLDPEDKDSKDSVNLLFSKLIGKSSPGEDSYSNAAVAIADHVGVVPRQVVDWARASITGGDPPTAAAAANVLSRLQETNPRAYSYALDHDEKTRAMAATISSAVQAGADPETTVNLARQNASLPKAQLDALAERWKTTVGDPKDAASKQESALTSILQSDPTFKPGWFSSVPSPPPLMQGEFDQLTQEYYKHTNGDLTQARELAAQDLKRTWGVSEVNGPRQIMQYAPEAMFPGLTPDVIRSDIAKTLQDNVALFENADPAKVRLTAIPATARTGGQEWGLGVPDKFGANAVVFGKDGNPLRYRLPVRSDDLDAVRDRQAQAAIAAARQKREDQQRGRDLAEAEPIGP